MRVAHSVAAAVLAFLAPVHAFAEPPESARPPRPETVFVSLKPCRAFDTRTKTPVAAKDRRAFLISGTDDLRGQGGPAGGCGVPVGATAVQLTLTVTEAAAAGEAVVFPAGQGLPDVFGNTYEANRPSATTSTTPLSTAAGSAGKLVVYTTRRAHVVGDVTGYYVNQIHALISGTGTIYSGSPSVISAVVNDTGNFTVTVDRDVTYCAPTATPYYAGYYAIASGLTGNAVNVRVWSLPSGVMTPVNTYLYLSVRC